MPPKPLRLIVALACCALAFPAEAITVTRIEISGLDDQRMAQNVRVALSLDNELGKDVSGRRLAYLLREAEAETREALEPFGYYAPTIVIQRSDRNAPEGTEAASSTRAHTAAEDIGTVEARALTVSIRIDPGTPVQVREWNVGVEGEAGEDAEVLAALAAFAPLKNEVLDHARYEASKSKISRVLASRGYFDADYAAHRVEVTRAEHAADIDLRWNSGVRYALGAATFTQSPQRIIRDDLLQKLVGWDVGEAYDDAELERLRRSLVALDYFGLVEVLPQPEHAVDTVTPVHVNLTPAPRSIYTLGVNYGTRSGAGFSAGLERRYLNTRGHKALAQLDYANKRKTATLQYKVPAFARLDGWYSASLQFADEQTQYVNSRRLEFVASRSGQYNDYLDLVASLHVLRERWAINVADDGDGAIAPIHYQFASFAFPELRAEYIDVDDRLTPRRGIGATLTLRGGKGGSVGRTSFAQAHLAAHWFHGLDADSRLIARGEIGHTFTDELLNLPPSLRYYAGGDRSVRGYGWREIGPRIRNSVGDTYALGAQNVVTASIEYERYFKGPWGAAVFVDSGSAFDGKSPDMHTGVGIGLRWRSPVGPVRIDIARGLKSPDSPFTLHLNIGADL